MENKKVTATSKLRSTEVLLNHDKHTTHFNSSLQTDYESSSFSYIQQNHNAAQNVST